MTTRRRILLAQLNTMLRLAGQAEVVRFHGSTQKLSARVTRMWKAL